MLVAQPTLNRRSAPKGRHRPNRKPAYASSMNIAVRLGNCVPLLTCKPPAPRPGSRSPNPVAGALMAKYASVNCRAPRVERRRRNTRAPGPPTRSGRDTFPVSIGTCPFQELRRGPGGMRLSGPAGQKGGLGTDLEDLVGGPEADAATVWLALDSGGPDGSARQHSSNPIMMD